MKFIFLLSFIGFLSAASNFRSPLRQNELAKAEVTLDHDTDETNDDSFVNVECLQGKIKLDLIRGPDKYVETTIQVGTPNVVLDAPGLSPTGCLSDRKKLPTLETTIENPCGRSEVDGFFLWDVKITEYEAAVGSAVGSGLDRYLESRFSVKCGIQVTASPVITQLPSAFQEGTQEFPSYITFSLTKSSGWDVRDWVFDLKPNDVGALAGLSYTIDSVIATPFGVASGPPQAILIAKGCIEDVGGTRVEPHSTPSTQINRIHVRPFRFSRYPAAEISLTASVKVCIPSTGVTLCKAPEACKPEDGGDDEKGGESKDGSNRQRRNIVNQFKHITNILKATTVVHNN